MDPFAADAGCYVSSDFDNLVVDVDAVVRDGFPPEHARGGDVFFSHRDKLSLAGHVNSPPNQTTHILPDHISPHVQGFTGDACLENTAAFSVSGFPSTAAATFDIVACSALDLIASAPSAPGEALPPTVCQPCQVGPPGIGAAGPLCPIHIGDDAARVELPCALMDDAPLNASQSRPFPDHPGCGTRLSTPGITKASCPSTGSAVVPTAVGSRALSGRRHHRNQEPSLPLALSIKAGPTKSEWEAMRTTIEKLYLDFNLPLRNVMSNMEERHGFRAT